MKVGGGIGFGLLLAFIGQFLALIMSGAGHGWNTPFIANLALWLLLPLTLATVSPLRPYAAGKYRYLLTLSLVGIALDIGLIIFTHTEGVEYLWRVMQTAGVIPLIWLFIWLSWQGVIALASSQGEALPEDVI